MWSYAYWNVRLIDAKSILKTTVSVVSILWGSICFSLYSTEQVVNSIETTTTKESCWKSAVKIMRNGYNEFVKRRCCWCFNEITFYSAISLKSNLEKWSRIRSHQKAICTAAYLWEWVLKNGGSFWVWKVKNSILPFSQHGAIWLVLKWSSSVFKLMRKWPYFIVDLLHQETVSWWVDGLDR